MDDQDIFQELSFGLRFDFKRFAEDVKILKGTKENSKTEGDAHKKDSSRLNFFEKESPSFANNCTESSRTDIGHANMQQLRKKHKIFIEGTDIPDLLTSFSQLETVFELPSFLTDALKNSFKFDNPTPIQMQAITVMLQRRDMLACAPTGSGKTLAFLIPVIAHCIGSAHSPQATSRNRLKTLIVSPTRELANQIFQVCKQLLVGFSDDSSSTSLKAQILDKSIMKKFQSAGSKHGSKYDVLISTPNRLVYLLTQDPPLINLESIEWLVVDESDKLFEEGEKGSFREQLAKIYSACTSKQIRRALFSATFAFDVQKWCHLNMESVIHVTVGGKNTAAKSVNQKLLFTGNERGKLIALQDLFRQGFKPPVLVFVQSKERAKQLFAELIYDGMNVDVIHSDRTPLQRENAVKASRTGKTWILICTELLSRGIDIKSVNLVINYDFPTSAISYIHRIGRTGRAGRLGEAITFFTEEDKPLLRSIANVIKETGCPVPDYLLKMKKLGKDERKKASNSEVVRETIRTTPKHILEKKAKRKPETGKDNGKPGKRRKKGPKSGSETTDKD